MLIYLLSATSSISRSRCVPITIRNFDVRGNSLLSDRFRRLFRVDFRPSGCTAPSARRPSWGTPSVRPSGTFPNRREVARSFPPRTITSDEIMNCSVSTVFRHNRTLHKYYAVFVVFVIGALCSILVDKYLDSAARDGQRSSRQLIVRRPFSIIDIDDPESAGGTDQKAHGLIVRETNVEVVCE